MEKLLEFLTNPSSHALTLAVGVVMGFLLRERAGKNQQQQIKQLVEFQQKLLEEMFDKE